MVDRESARLLTPVAEEKEAAAAASSQFSCFGCCFGSGYENNAQNWWRQGLSKSIKKAQEWSESVADHAGNSGQKLRNIVRRLKNRNNNNQNGRNGRFQYDASSYALNFDDGSRQEHQPFPHTSY